MIAYQQKASGNSGLSQLQQWLTRLSKWRLAVVVIAVVAGLSVLYFSQTAGNTKVTLLPSQPQDAEASSSGIEPGSQLDNISALTGALSTPADQTRPELTEVGDLEFFVHISGAVNQPGVVCLASGSRLVDAVFSCGGLTADAAADYVNLAALLVDGTHIHIPSQSDIDALREQGVSPEQSLLNGIDQTREASGLAFDDNNAAAGYSSSSTNQQSGFPIDINSADMTALQTVPGIGPVTAQRIIDYRRQYGSFRRLEDLKSVSGIGDKRYADMLPYLTCK
ncbi:MAG: ComEA family DNA-binding protein [Coriobacteriales bacterium]|nr:ComEA family DNA-binding protein [Coriobacteriales bacterium]